MAVTIAPAITQPGQYAVGAHVNSEVAALAAAALGPGAVTYHGYVGVLAATEAAAIILAAALTEAIAAAEAGEGWPVVAYAAIAAATIAEAEALAAV